MPGAILGSAKMSLSVSSLSFELSGWLMSTWCSIIGLVGMCTGGVSEVIVVLFVGPPLWAGDSDVITLFDLVIFEFQKVIGSVVPTCAFNGTVRSKGFPFPSSQTNPSPVV